MVTINIILEINRTETSTAIEKEDNSKHIGLNSFFFLLFFFSFLRTITILCLMVLDSGRGWFRASVPGVL